MIAFLGYVNNSPKWFYINISYLINLIVVCYTISSVPLKKGLGGELNNKLIYPLLLKQARNTKKKVPLSFSKSSSFQRVGPLDWEWACVATPNLFSNKIASFLQNKKRVGSPSDNSINGVLVLRRTALGRGEGSWS